MNKVKASYPLKFPISLKSAAERLAREDGVSLNPWINVALAEKVGAMETAKEFFQQRAEAAQPEDLLVILDRAGRETPVHGDEVAR
jgi:hypothetical protein